MSLDALLPRDDGQEGGASRHPLPPTHPDRHRWLAVWANLRAGTMPPVGQPGPCDADRRRIVTRIEQDVFGVDADRPDPGPTVLRRLNRVEYANTVRDLTGLDIDVIDDLPADDTGHGFDTIAAVLSVSPLLLEKYLAEAAAVGDRVAAVRSVESPEGAIAYPERFRVLFPFGPPPADPGGRDGLRRRTLERLASRGFRRPADGPTVDRLVAVALAAEAGSGSFEQGIAMAVSAVLSSPRFLFRVEADAPRGDTSDAVPIDEHSLASRLSYFLWSSMPDEEIFSLAARGRLRAELHDVVDRMIRDPRADAFVAGFAGQWLQTRDVETLPFSLKRIVEGVDAKDEAKVQDHFDEKLRPAMRMETEMVFAHILRDGLPATDLLVGRSTFLNADLARHYGIAGVEGEAMRLVELPPESRRGGVLTHGSVLAVTSTPSRTSPVKRGLFILDNLVGAPPPPAPPDIPPLEASAKKARKGASVRELLALHRQDAACASCHARMDPLGFALEEYDAIGRWRGEGAVAGRLATGESFTDARDLARRIAIERRRDFHRCLVEKLFAYAVGRGVEVFDSPTVERIVERLETEGRLDAAVHGIVASVPFQMRRRAEPGTKVRPETIPSSSTQARR